MPKWDSGLPPFAGPRPGDFTAVSIIRTSPSVPAAPSTSPEPRPVPSSPQTPRPPAADSQPRFPCTPQTQNLARDGQGDARVRREPLQRPRGASPQQGLSETGPRGLHREAGLLFLRRLFQGLPAPQLALCFFQRLHRGLGQQEALGDTQRKAQLRVSASELCLVPDPLLSGDVVVPVANCGVQEYNSNPKEHMPLRDYISYWKEYIQANYSSSRGCLYLKDWHLCRDFLAEGVFTLPIYFSSDWLNEYWDALDVDDYRFVYMGPTGTCWSVNICGRKKWFFFPPGQEEALRDCHGGLPYDVTSPTLLDSRLHPMRDRCGPPLEVTQEAGEMVFVPSGWHHQVHNLEDTISINHNWVNGCNLANMWHFLQQELSAVQQEVIEWRDTMPDWHHHCQVIMKSCSGINFEEFYHFLKIIAERRLLLLAKGMSPGQVEGGEDTGLGPQQAAFDIGRIAEVLESVVAHPDFQRVDPSTFSPRPEVLLRQLEEAVAATTSL
ncbi:jmjC domain-containing protein 4 isoform X2 [Bos indicus x Bos taurus]|uniref:jmjC domain-containing protein 4 isoform X2 n=1 Tax=Bos indicus x Bos taurus TaxID=30522 RepID=UPI000F7D22BD|nr:jmjC domain-containing protein 4 isoform X2 [Bos indicus x Bos taurus]